MKNIMWMAGGMIIVSAVFFIPEQKEGIWPSVWWSSLAAGAYLLLTVMVWIPQVHSKTKRWFVVGTLAVLAVSAMASLSLWQYMSNWHRELLPEIRTTIENGTAMRLTYQPLVRTLGDYHQAGGNASGPGLGQLFRTRYGSSVAEDHRLEFGGFDKDHTLSLYLSHTDADSVVIVGESEYVEGRDPGFQNYSGRTGLFQVRGILTREGVRYGRVN